MSGRGRGVPALQRHASALADLRGRAGRWARTGRSEGVVRASADVGGAGCVVTPGARKPCPVLRSCCSPSACSPPWRFPGPSPRLSVISRRWWDGSPRGISAPGCTCAAATSFGRWPTASTPWESACSPCSRSGRAARRSWTASSPPSSRGSSSWTAKAGSCAATRASRSLADSLPVEGRTLWEVVRAPRLTELVQQARLSGAAAVGGGGDSGTARCSARWSRWGSARS